MLRAQIRSEGSGDLAVVVTPGFLQKVVPEGVQQMVDQAIELINPQVVVQVIPDYEDLLRRVPMPTWTEFALQPEGVGIFAPFNGSRILALADSWGTPLWEIFARENPQVEVQVVGFRVPRIGEDRISLVEKYQEMAGLCQISEAFAKYRKRFPLLPGEPEMAAKLFLGAAKSDLDRFSPNVVGVRGFHDDLFHPAQALEKVDAVFDTVEQALARLGLI